MIKVAAGLLIFLATFSIVSEANAIVCARGFYRAGCAASVERSSPAVRSSHRRYGLEVPS